MPRLSVIIPARNAQRFVGRALSSTMRTLPRDAEVRVMDDGSTDGTLSILQRWAERDSRVHVSSRVDARGVWCSLNELARAADCEILGRMDADDICLPGRWSASRRILKTADVASHCAVFIDDGGRVTGVDQPGHFTAQAMPLHLLMGCVVVHPSVAMRRTHFEQMGGYRDTAAEDYELWMRSALSGARIVRSALPGLAYRIHPGQVTVSRPWGEEGRDQPLDQAYTHLARNVLGDEFGGDPFVALTAVLAGAATAHEADSVRDLLRAVDKASRRLPALDAAQIRWRVRRMRGRLLGADCSAN